MVFIMFLFPLSSTMIIRLFSSTSRNFRCQDALDANNAWKIAPIMIRKMQVPAYWPVLEGVQPSEIRAVCVEVKKVLIIDDMCIMPLDVTVDEDMGISMMRKSWWVSDLRLVVVLQTLAKILSFSAYGSALPSECRRWQFVSAKGL